jgi:hypothetical protein
MLTFVLKTIEDDSISGDKIHGGYVSGLTGLEVLAGGPGVDINAGNIDGTNIGTDVPGTGKFISLQIVGMQPFIEANVSWIGNLGNEVVGIHSLGDIGEILLKVGGFTRIKLNASPLTQSYFLNQLLIGTSTLLVPTALLQVSGDAYVSGTITTTSIVASNGTFNNALSFLTSGGMKTAYAVYDRFVPIESWYLGLGVNKRYQLTAITEDELVQINKIESVVISNMAWNNLSTSDGYPLIAMAWSNLKNSSGYELTTQNWSHVATLDQSVAEASTPKFAVSLTNAASLAYSKTVNVLLQTTPVQPVHVRFTIVGGSSANPGSKACTCVLNAYGSQGSLSAPDPYLYISPPSGGVWPSECLPLDMDTVCPIIFDIEGGKQVSGYILIPKVANAANPFIICKYDKSNITGNTGISQLMDSVFSYQL